jgi:hypothetical protein
LPRGVGWVLRMCDLNLDHRDLLFLYQRILVPRQCQIIRPIQLGGPDGLGTLAEEHFLFAERLRASLSPTQLPQSRSPAIPEHSHPLLVFVFHLAPVRVPRHGATSWVRERKLQALHIAEATNAFARTHLCELAQPDFLFRMGHVPHCRALFRL